MKKVTVSIVIITTTIILLPQLTMLGKNICTTNNIIAIANGINLLILTFEKTYFLPKNDTPKVKANNNIKYNIHFKKFIIIYSLHNNILIYYKEMNIFST